MWTPPHGLTSTAIRFEDVTEQSDVETTKENTHSSRRSVKRPGNRKDRSSPTGSRRQSRSRSPHQERTSTSGGGITGTLSGLFTSAQEAIGASWAAATAEGEISARRTASISAQMTPSKQTAPTPPGRLGTGQETACHQEGPPPSGGGTPLPRAAWRTTKHRRLGRGRAQRP